MEYIVLTPPAPDDLYPTHLRPCECVDQREHEGWIKAANLPPIFAEADFDGYRQLPTADLAAADAVERWAHEGEGSLLLFGTVRKGKTWLECAAGRVRMQNGQRTQFMKSPDLFNEMRNSYDPTTGGPRPSELLEAVREVPLLLLDDIGVEQIPRDRSWMDQLFYQVVDHRHDYLRPMLITTNLGITKEFEGEPYEELLTRMQRRTVERLAEMVGPNVIRVGGATQRRGGR